MDAPRLVASMFGIGHSPLAPGTVASLVALPLGGALLAWHPLVLAVAILAITLLGLWSLHAGAIDGDPAWVVIDEVAGQWVALITLAAPTLPGLLAAFALFRLFDIAKPGPVRLAERVRGAGGIMADDLVAGALAALVLLAAHWFAPGLIG
jgi:phosphatidylglycerophosphatase A